MGNLSKKQKKIFRQPLSLTIEITDPELIAILLSRARGMKWTESCKIASECGKRGKSINRHIAVAALGTLIIEAAKRDETICIKAIQAGVGINSA